MDSVQWGLIGVLILLSVTLIWVYCKNAIATRNEAEYRDIVEYQTMLAAALISQHPSLIPDFQKVRYFPDQSGFFVVLDFTGKVLCHGDYDGDIDQPLPFNLPINSILETARNGGGYVRYNYKGHIYESFVYVYPGSSYIVCSGLFIDIHHIQKRLDTWTRVDRTLLKSNSGGGVPLRKKVSRRMSNNN
jgi:hypothetical protein